MSNTSSGVWIILHYIMQVLYFTSWGVGNNEALYIYHHFILFVCVFLILAHHIYVMILLSCQPRDESNNYSLACSILPWASSCSSRILAESIRWKGTFWIPSVLDQPLCGSTTRWINHYKFTITVDKHRCPLFWNIRDSTVVQDS